MYRRLLILLFCGQLSCAVRAADFADAGDRMTLGMGRAASGAEVRLLSWNVKAGSLFPASQGTPEGDVAGARIGRFGRIVRAVRPDVMCLQEIWPLRRQADLQAMLDRELPLADGGQWHLQREVDVVIASRFPISLRRGERVVPYPLPGMPDFHYGTALALINLSGGLFAGDLMVVTAHFRSRSGSDNVRLREQHTKSILSWARDWQTPGGRIDLVRGTPVVVAGDLNVYVGNENEPLRHLDWLKSGLPADATDGVKRYPDWDRSSLKDLQPLVNGEGPASYTWRNDTQPYPPGALDRILFTDSVLEASAAFVLETTALPAERLRKYGLRRDDCLLAGQEGVYDHLPLVVDFRMKP